LRDHLGLTGTKFRLRRGVMEMSCRQGLPANGRRDAASPCRTEQWRNEGVEHPFRVRIGINTGFCNVGNFGSADRMDYTIIGAEVNLASRLLSLAEPGHMVASYETYALVRDIVVAHALSHDRNLTAVAVLFCQTLSLAGKDPETGIQNAGVYRG
jgi:class 3 adenylate cyclase